MANPPTHHALIANIRGQLRQIANYQRDTVSLRPVEWDMVIEALQVNAKRGS